MQNLGLTPPVESEGRLKSIFWPSIKNDADVDSVARQGLWVCLAVAAFDLVIGIVAGTVLIALLEAVFFFLGAMGIRQLSRVAAAAVFVLFFSSWFLGGGFSIPRVIFTAMLLATLRGVWLASGWKLSGEAPLTRFNETWTDKIADQLPTLLWPKTKWIFYILAVLELIGFVGLFIRHIRA